MKENDYLQATFSESGTNVDEVKRNNANSGMTYNEVKKVLANTIGNLDEGSYSQTDIANVKQDHL